MRKDKNTILKTLGLILAFSTLFGINSCKKSKTTPAETGVDLTHIAFGDAKILRRDKGQSTPAVGFLWLCGVPADGHGNTNAKDWTNSDGTWDFTRKPIVAGQVTWNSQFSAVLDGKGNRIITGNALPVHPTGIFPVTPGTKAYQYDPNPNAILPRTITYTVPAIPQVALRPSCLTYGESGIALSGAVIYHPSSTLANDAAAYEMLDSFGGQSDGTNTYHYHFLTEKLKTLLDTSGAGHSALMGYMKDGFGIFGPRGEDGKILYSKDLDECHGHIHPVWWDGKMVNIYHYHWTYDFPYNIGCYRGTP